MNVIEELQSKIDDYIDMQSPAIQDNFLEDIERIKNDHFHVYISQKLINSGIEVDDKSVVYQFLSKENCTLAFDTNKKLSYKNNLPFFFIQKYEFDLDNCYRGENGEIDSTFLEFLLFALNQKWDEIDNDDNFWFFIPNCEVQEDTLKDFFQFILLVNGYTFHQPIETTENQFIDSNIKSILDCTKNFNQYQESAYILSEYNHTKDILLKYLLLYHIIENFMYRRPIAEMANTKFTIRDFKRLYKTIDKDEIGTLLVFFKKILNEELFVGMTIESYVNNKLDDLRNLGLLDIKDFISILAFDFSNLSYSAGNNNQCKDFRRFMYQLRNSIVHNKETEFHVTHSTFQEFPELRKLFEIFLLPTLENIIYYLIFKNNSIIDYPKNHLLLYGEHCET